VLRVIDGQFVPVASNPELAQPLNSNYPNIYLDSTESVCPVRRVRMCTVGWQSQPHTPTTTANKRSNRPLTSNPSSTKNRFSSFSQVNLVEIHLAAHHSQSAQET